MLDFGLGDDYSIPDFGLNFGEYNGFATDGQIGVTQRANDSFLGFDQSKIGSSIFDVMSSLGSAASSAVGKAVGKTIGDAINPSDNNSAFLRNFFSSFTSTKTGQQVQKEAIFGSLQNFFLSPVVWIISAVGILAFIMIARRK